MALTYVATCRDHDCLWHQSPARFSDYLERQVAVGYHRLSTGHRVDMTQAPDTGSDPGPAAASDEKQE